MRLAKFLKEPGERKRYVLDYSEWLEDSETITGVSFSVTPSGSLVVDSYSIGSPATDVAFFVSSGTDGVSYTVEAQITTSVGQIREDQITYAVKEY